MQPQFKHLDSLQMVMIQTESLSKEIQDSLKEIDSFRAEIQMPYVELIPYEPKDYMLFGIMMFFVFSVSFMFISLCNSIVRNYSSKKKKIEVTFINEKPDEDVKV